MTSRVLGLITAEIALVAIGLLFLWQASGASWGNDAALVVVYTIVMIVLVSLPRVYFEQRRHGCWITPADTAILVGLFYLAPLTFVAACLLAEVVILVRERQAPLKAAFNLVNGVGGFTAAAVVFTSIGRGDPLDPVAWLAGIAALAACSAWDVLSTSAVLAVAEREPLSRSVRQNGPPLVASLTLSAAIGLPAVILFDRSAWLIVVLLPLLVLLVANARGVSQQHAERLRFQRLYDASTRLARLRGLEETLQRIVEEARGLVTGSAAVCVIERSDGRRNAFLVDDDGCRPFGPPPLTSLLEVTRRAERGQVDLDEVDPRLRADLPAGESLVWAMRSGERLGVLHLAVLRELPSDADDPTRTEVLDAFATQAATVVANVQLHEDVRHALGHQLELNRQKGEFVAAVSHELRTPLASLLGSIQTIQRLDGRLGPDERRRVLDLGLTQGARLHALIEDLLLVAAADHRRVPTELVPMDIGAVLAELFEELAPLSQGRLVVKVPPELPTVTTDVDKVRRILTNLVQNAVKYAPEGAIHLEAAVEDERVVLSVTDEGPGIPEADRDRVFERFVQLDGSAARREGGTGLGLHLSRQLAELVGGTLEVTGAPTGGARFEFRSHLLVGGGTAAGTDDRAVADAGDEATATSPTWNGVLASPASTTRRSPDLAQPVG